MAAATDQILSWLTGVTARFICYAIFCCQYHCIESLVNTTDSHFCTMPWANVRENQLKATARHGRFMVGEEADQRRLGGEHCLSTNNQEQSAGAW